MPVARPARPPGFRSAPVIETDRLSLREMTPGDLDFVAAMLADPEVMRHYPGPLGRAGAREWLDRQLRRYAEHGHGLWLAVDRASGSPVGQVGLMTQEVEGTIEREIGYLLHRPFWHRGFATEAAEAVREYAFRRLALPRVISLIRPVNAASQAVALRLGMSPEREVPFKGLTHVVFAVGPRGRSGPGGRPGVTGEPSLRWSDAWLLTAIHHSSRAAPAPLTHILAAADLINHATPRLEETASGLHRLERAGLIARAGESLSFECTPRALDLFRAVTPAATSLFDLWKRLEVRLGVAPWSPGEPVPHPDNGRPYPALTEGDFFRALEDSMSPRRSPRKP